MKDNNSLNNLLIIDDDTHILKMLSKIFRNHYTIKIAQSASDAFKILDSGFMPGVIVADHELPGIRGSEILSQSAKYAPNATRILMTGHYESKEILNLISEAKAYYFLCKPFIELQILQAVKVGFDKHRATLSKAVIEAQKRKIVADTAKLQNEINRASNSIQGAFIGFTDTIASYLNYAEKSFYFAPHTVAVLDLVQRLGKSMNMGGDSLRISLFAAKLHNLPILLMPSKLRISNPFDMTSENEFRAFFEHYNKALATLASNKELKIITDNLALIYERSDGTGFPNQLSQKDITKESQMVAISSLFHDLIYKVNQKQFSELKAKGEVMQTKEETTNRTERALRYIRNKETWFLPIIYSSFLEIVETYNNDDLFPNTTTLLIHDYEFDFQVEKFIEN